MASANYLKPFERAWDGMVERLFSPFDWKVWAKLGLLAWLACLFEGPLSLSSLINMPGDKKGECGKSALCSWHPASSELIAIISIAAIIAIALIIIGFVLLWIKARGKFMFIDGLVRGVDAASFKERWGKFRAQGNSFFGFLVCWSIAVFAACALPLLGSGGLLIYGVAKGNGGFEGLLRQPVLLSTAIALLLISLALALAASILTVIITDFGTLHMYKNGSSAWTAAWKALCLIKTKPVQMAVYLLSLICIAIAAGAVTICLVLTMCLLCCSCLLLYLPYVWAALLLPVLAFRRLFTIEFAVNAGEEFEIAVSNAKPAKG